MVERFLVVTIHDVLAPSERSNYPRLTLRCVAGPFETYERARQFIQFQLPALRHREPVMVWPVFWPEGGEG